ncbi:MAG: phosphatase [Deltaproteobacteria bacterium]|nr:MAG: phosphatase [Deltaproteobacteria bacterium]
MLRERLSEHRARRRANKELKAATRERFRIRLRRFAGHELHAEQLTQPIRVAHITDQHVGLVTPHKVQVEAVDIVNREKPDVVVLTGDFVCHSHAWLDELTALMRRFEAPVYGVLGNHDHWAGAKQVRRALRKGGVELLNNANTTITIQRQTLQLVGLDDAYTGHADRDKAIKGLNAKLPTLGLSHIAEEADGLWNAGVPLVLSGHTHAGQLTVARLNEWTIGRLAKHRFIHGLYGARASDGIHSGAVYVGAGIGAAVMPFRLGDRGNREVTLFELGARPGDLSEHHDEQDVVPIPDDHDEEAARAFAKERFAQRQAKKKKKR